MFYYISGTLVLTDTSTAVVDNNGIAYKMTVSATTIGKLSSSVGKQVRLYTYMNIYQDGMDLYGFHSLEELEAFKMLISVSGVGPKAAMSVLSQFTPEQFAIAVASEDTKLISKAPGVGGKTAARIVLELKDKIAKQTGEVIRSDEGITAAASGGNYTEALNALMVLGYSKPEAINALRKTADKTLSLEQMITAALKILSER